MREWYIQDGTIKSYSGISVNIEIPIEIYGHEIHEIGDFAFSPNNGKIKQETSINRNKIETVVIPDGVTKIGSYAFWGCSSLKEVHIPKSIEIIENNAFEGCTALESIQLPSKVQIGGEAFKGCTSLREFYLPEVWEKSYSHHINWFTPAGCFSNCTSLTNVHIPEGVEKIAHGTFFGCSSLKQLIIPESVQVIEGSAFSKSCLTEIFIPEKITEISYFMFSFCTHLYVVHLPNKLKKIAEGAFEYCSLLKSVDLPEGLEIIDSNAFRKTALAEITIPASVQVLWPSAFAECDNLTRIIVLGEKTEIKHEDRWEWNPRLGHNTRQEGQSPFPKNPRFCLAGPKYSYAREYASKYDIPFEEI